MPESTAARIRSARGEPPGSRVVTTSRGPRSGPARSQAASRVIWVDLPAPSPPSKVMKPPGRASTSAGAPVTIVPVTTCW